MVLDLGLPDMTGFQLITRVKSEIGLRKLPTIVYTGKQLTQREEAELRRLAESVVIKDAARPSGCWTRPRCSSTGSPPSCPTASAGCWSSCTAPTRRSPAARC